MYFTYKIIIITTTTTTTNNNNNNEYKLLKVKYLIFW